MQKTGEDRYVPALGFSWLTPAYDVAVALTTRERTFKTALIQQAGLAPGHRVLDLGCGTGTLALWIHKRHPDVMIRGLDGDPKMLARARSKAAGADDSVRFDEGMSWELPYPDNHFDRVVSSLFFHHLSWEDKMRTAHEIHRVLRPGGELHVADWGRARNPVMRGAFLFIQILDGFGNTRDHVAGRLLDLFHEANFIGVEETRSYSTVFGTMSLYRAGKANQ